MIEKYQEWIGLDKPDIRSICMSLDKFVQFLNDDHPEIIVRNGVSKVPFRRKNPRTIKTYLGFVKSYLRMCHDVKVNVEDIQQYIQFPKVRKEPRKPVTLEQLKQIMAHANPRRALYYVLVTSGMRLGEALMLTKGDLHLNENPVRITIRAENTKTKEGRETYISAECVEKLKPLIEHLDDSARIFTDEDNVGRAVSLEGKRFSKIRKKIGLTDRYENSIRHVTNIHSFRAYFHTKASQKHGAEYANAMDGHSGYLSQYYREDPKQRAQKYLELEQSH